MPTVFMAMFCAHRVSACATMPKGPLTLPQQLSHPATINLPLLTDDSGLMIVHVGLPGGSKARFVIDTGATLSSIYPEVKTRLGLSLEARTSVRVHGMIKAQLLARDPSDRSLELGGQSIGPLRVAVISKQIGGCSRGGNKRAGYFGHGCARKLSSVYQSPRANPAPNSASSRRARRAAKIGAWSSYRVIHFCKMGAPCTFFQFAYWCRTDARNYGYGCAV